RSHSDPVHLPWGEVPFRTRSSDSDGPMSLSQNKSDRGQSGRTARTSALVAACILTVGSLSLTAPAEAAVTCAFDAATATLTLDKQDAVTIVRVGDDIVVRDDAV